ncbi:acetylornithine deacetylase [Agromyces rhizosphaerae]|uniref:Acetylornithine deacetylase n=2 Tax=Agromyces rhizosphaerae TaxID=88374 RepID=A0A9W6CVT7_9MICO|nr:acetylornithine deacetylase [Agromyces rhizosphaerae]
MTDAPGGTAGPDTASAPPARPPGHDAELVALARELVALDSVNPDLDPSGAGEVALAHALRRRLDASGFSTTLIGPGARPSLVARRRGTGGGRTLLLSGHLDTVGVRTYADGPFAPRVDGDQLWGRGAYDMKGALAAGVLAAERATAGDELAGDVVLAFAADEEFGSIGTEAVLASLDTAEIDGALVLEPTGLELGVAHRGFAWFALEVHGRAAHGSQPEQGVDAIAGMLRLVAALDADPAPCAPEQGHPLLGTSTLRVATLEGGVDAATVAPHCRATIERRTLPGETPAVVRAALEATLARAAGSDVSFQLTELVSRPAFEAPDGSAVVAAVDRAAVAELGALPDRRGDPWWTEAALFADAGIDVALYGPAGGGAHADAEWLDLPSAATHVRVLERVLRDVCG